MAVQTIALIMAAGSGSRYGGEIPKVYTELHGKTVLRRSVEAFLSHPRVDAVRVVIRRADHMRFKRAVEGISSFPCVVGGERRQDSVRRGLESIARTKPRFVLIHDAARPLVSHALIDRVLDALEQSPAVLPATAVVDTLRQNGALIDRTGMIAAQTPQGFHFDAILDAHHRFAADTFTDDIALAEAAGLAVSVVEGERANIKLTTADDFHIMQKLAESQLETRIGFGVDVHPLVPHDADAPVSQRHITLCGVKIPSEFHLHGHSDADACLHALVDAMLGAIGAGDIGQHFPPSDPQWKGADSSRFLLHAYELLCARGGEIVNIDITVMAEKPKIAPYRQQMADMVTSLLKLSAGRVNIKATTTEKLGFLGRGEGLAAQAAIAIRLPA